MRCISKPYSQSVERSARSLEPIPPRQWPSPLPPSTANPLLSHGSSCASRAAIASSQPSTQPPTALPGTPPGAESQRRWPSATGEGPAQGGPHGGSKAARNVNQVEAAGPPELWRAVVGADWAQAAPIPRDATPAADAYSTTRDQPVEVPQVQWLAGTPRGALGEDVNRGTACDADLLSVKAVLGAGGRATGDRSASSSASAGGDSGNDDSGGSGGGGGGDSYVLNLGTAVRVLREDLPQLLQRPLRWDIYRDDIEFLNPWSLPLRGLGQYQLLHRVMRIMARILYARSTVELLRIWTPMGGGGSGGGMSNGSSLSSPAGGSIHGRSDGGGDSRGEHAGGGANAGGNARNGGDSAYLSSGQLRVRWRARGQPWLPWSEEHRLEVVATYRFDRRGLIAVHELTTVIPPEPPMLLWPLLAVAQMLGQVQGRGQEGEGRDRIPIPGACEGGGG